MPSSSSRLSTCRFRATTSAERREAIEVDDLVRRRWNIESIKGLGNNNEVPLQETDDVHHVKDHGGDINLTSVFFHVLLVLNSTSVSYFKYCYITDLFTVTAVGRYSSSYSCEANEVI